VTAVQENPEMVRLFRAYTNPLAPARDSTGDHLTRSSYEDCLADPLLVATGTHLALFPGDGRPPTVNGFRHTTVGFKELAGISHLGPAIASLVRLEHAGRREQWRADARRLLDDITEVRSANTVRLWREAISAPSFVGREEKIAAMVDYACSVTARFLDRALAEQGYLTARSLRDDLIKGHPDGRLPVDFGRVMIATFALVGTNNSARLIRWFDGLDVDWARALVMFVGRQGRPTAGVTKSTNSLARIIQLASRGRLADDQLFIAPHAPEFPAPDGGDVSKVVALEDPLRWMLARVMASVSLASVMYDGYPRFEPPSSYGPDVDEHTTTVTEMPRIKSPDDWSAMITRLRLALEDPRQLLASGVTDYMAEQLIANDNDPSAVVIPGLDNVCYPSFRGSQ